MEAVGIQIIHLFLTAEVAVSCKGNDFHIGAHHQKGHIEAYLVVAGAGGAVSNGAGANLAGIAGYGNTLENALG